MAQSGHLEKLKQGIQVWNKWRLEDHYVKPDLSEADFSYANLKDANLNNVYFWRSVFTGADLRGANLSGANLTEADFTGAKLEGALMTTASLGFTNFTGANLKNVDLKGAEFYDTTLNCADTQDSIFHETYFVNTDLSEVKNLESCRHEGDSIIDHRTFAKSKIIPVKFLEGCKLTGWQIEAAKLNNPNLTQIEFYDTVERIYQAVYEEPIQRYSCFISYSRKDQEFVQKLHKNLLKRHVLCWFDMEDMKTGDYIREKISTTIERYEKLILILSENSIDSEWVKFEFDTAREKEDRLKEKKENKVSVLFPIRIDEKIMVSKSEWIARIISERNIGDFTNWKDEESYNVSFERLIRDLSE